MRDHKLIIVVDYDDIDAVADLKGRIDEWYNKDCWSDAELDFYMHDSLDEVSDD